MIQQIRNFVENQYMNVICIMATCGRHTLAERSLGMFLQQVDTGDVKNTYKLLIYNNSDVSMKLEDGFMEKVDGLKSVLLVNEHRDSRSGMRYSNLGAIYRDALECCDIDDDDILVHWDDDDLFLPNHLSEGVKGLNRAKALDSKEEFPADYVAYKPAKSYYRHPGGLQLMSNTLEPSIFVEGHHMKKWGYNDTTTDQHLKWVNPLVYERRIFVDETGTSTLVYDWNSPVPTFKTSGNAGHPRNFDNYRDFSQDHGNRILTPWDKNQIDNLFKTIGL